MSCIGFTYKFFNNDFLNSRSEPLPYDGLANGYAVAAASSGQKKAGSLNPNRILIKRVGMAADGGDAAGLLAACGSCANGGCCIS